MENSNLEPVTPKGKGEYYYDANFAYRMQWLAVKIACKGIYDMAYTGDFRAKNPTDYYKTRYCLLLIPVMSFAGNYF